MTKHNLKHGLAVANKNRHPLFGLWKRMRQRCRDAGCDDFKDYGGRGIKVCARWDDFAAFLKDMGPRPTPKHTLDRKDNDGDYEPGNVRWATPLEQARHTRRNALTETDVQNIRDLRACGRSPRQIAVALGLSPYAVKHVIHDGTWAKEDRRAQAG